MTTISSYQGLTIDSNVIFLTPLMCVEVAAIVPPYHQALLRCAGSVGVDVYEEVVERGKAPLYIENTNKEDGSITSHIPTTLPITSEWNPRESVGATAVLVLTHDYLAIRNGQKMVTMYDYPIHVQLKYVFSGKETEPNPTPEYESGTFQRAFKGFTSIELCGVSNITNLRNFMTHFTTLTCITLSAFTNVTTLGDLVLSSCSALSSADLSGLSNVTTIGNAFLSGCVSLTSIDLSPFSKVTSVGASFMSECYSLASVDLSPFDNVTEVGDAFMSYCMALTSIDLTPFGNVTKIGECCLMDCTSLATIDLTPLVSLKVLGGSFMYNCTALMPETRSGLLQAVKDRNNKQCHS